MSVSLIVLFRRMYYCVQCYRACTSLTAQARVVCVSSKLPSWLTGKNPSRGRCHNTAKHNQDKHNQEHWTPRTKLCAHWHGHTLLSFTIFGGGSRNSSGGGGGGQGPQNGQSVGILKLTSKKPLMGFGCRNYSKGGGCSGSNFEFWSKI